MHKQLIMMSDDKQSVITLQFQLHMFSLLHSSTDEEKHHSNTSTRLDYWNGTFIHCLVQGGRLMKTNIHTPPNYLMPHRF